MVSFILSCFFCVPSTDARIMQVNNKQMKMDEEEFCTTICCVSTFFTLFFSSLFPISLVKSFSLVRTLGYNFNIYFLFFKLTSVVSLPQLCCMGFNLLRFSVIVFFFILIFIFYSIVQSRIYMCVSSIFF